MSDSQSQSHSQPESQAQVYSELCSFPLEPFELQRREHWPPTGRHVMAHCGRTKEDDEDYVVVYQAYNDDIGRYAAQNNKFAGAPGWQVRCAEMLNLLSSCEFRISSIRKQNKYYFNFIFFF